MFKPKCEKLTTDGWRTMDGRMDGRMDDKQQAIA